MNVKKAVLVASFGTSHSDALKLNIEPIEAQIRAAFPEYQVYRAFTSSIVIRLLKRRGIEVDTPEEALDNLIRDGISEVIVQPTHIIDGEEVEKLKRVCMGKEALFDRLKITAPLLSGTEDFKEVIRIMAGVYGNVPEDTAVVLVGHGSRHGANSAYPALDYIFKEQGHSRFFIGTVESYPDGDTVLKLVRNAGYKKVLLAPLLLVAGDHAKNDIAGDEADSWKSRFESAGLPVTVSLRGLGEYPEIQALYAAHTREAM